MAHENTPAKSDWFGFVNYITPITVCLHPYRFVEDFNSIYEIMITYHFVWSLSNIGSTLLVLNIILVSCATYINYCHSFCEFKFNLLIAVTTTSRPYSDDYAIYFSDMVIFPALFLLWSRTIRYKSIWRFWGSNIPNSFLVFVSNWNAKDASDRNVEYTTDRCSSWLSKCIVHEGSIQ